MEIVRYQVLVAGEDDMERWGLPFKTEEEAVSCAKHLRREYIGSIMVEKITTEIIFNS